MPVKKFMFSEKILTFYKQLDINSKVPKGIGVMNPYQIEYTSLLCEKFYQKYYHDDRPRTLMVGINPGRFGSGLTGISFTDPIRLETVCGIENSLVKKPELSSEFIYRMIEAFGGVEKFYRQYFISAVSPLGFIKEGKNINYYDDRKLEKAITPFAIDSIGKIIAMGVNTDKCFCIGEGKNFTYLKKLNEERKWFGRIIPLAHPRFIMQYRRKTIQSYVDEYLRELTV